MCNMLNAKKLNDKGKKTPRVLNILYQAWRNEF